MIRFVGLLGAMAILGCAGPSQPGGSSSPNNQVQGQVGTGFELSPGQEARVQGTPLIVKFIGVTNESRCPSDVQCVWAGNAVVRLSMRQATGSPEEASLNTTLDPKSAVFAGFRVRLVALRPTPKSTSAIPAADYVATLEVTPP